jgi:hypothetical protein
MNQSIVTNENKGFGISLHFGDVEFFTFITDIKSTKISTTMTSSPIIMSD